MGKQIGSMRFIGRFGNAIGYKARDGRGDAFDAQRIIATTVANPQTLSQMSQRMKLTPVQNFYRGLQGLLDHSWQGVKYGNPSRLHFYSLAMSRLNTSGVPYVLKGNRQFIPWSFPISEGSIPVAMLPEVEDSNDGDMRLQISANSIATLGELTTALMADYIGIRSGMQLTFIWIYESGGLYVPAYKRLTLDAASNTTLAELGFSFNKPENETFYTVTNLNADGDPVEDGVAAAGIIVSALVGSTWQRNTTHLVIANKLLNTYNSQAAFDAMLASYRTSNGSNESDWYLNGGENEGSSTVSTIKEVTAEVGAIEPTFAYYKIGATKYVPYFVDGEGIDALSKTYRKESDYAFTKTGASSLGVATAISDTTAEFAAAGYSLITRTDLLALAPELTIPA